MKRFLLFFILLGLLFGGWVFIKRHFFFSYKNITNIRSQGTDIILIGDSITHGFGVGEQDAYPAILERHLGLKLIKEGRDGETTSSALARLDELMLDKNPRIVVVFLGGNDFLQKAPADLVEKNLAEMITKIHKSGTMVVLVGIRTGVLTDDYGKVYERLSKQFGTAYVPNILHNIIGHDELMLDPIHPNEKGHEVIAERILKVLKPLIAESEKYR